MKTLENKSRRGRPPKNNGNFRDTKSELIRCGLAHLTEKGFVASGLDTILKHAGVPKGSFYFYFSSKEVFGHEVLQSYAKYFEDKLDRFLLDTTYPPLARIKNFVEDAKCGMTKHHFKRGCLVGNLGQEVELLPDSFREKLIEIFVSWQNRVAQCLRQAQLIGEISKVANCHDIAAFFWTGWEGAVTRAKLEESVKPLDNYVAFFLSGLPKAQV